MAGISWSEVESAPWFPELSPEGKSQALDKWLNFTLEREEDPNKALEISAFAEARKKNFFGEKVEPDQIFRPLVERRVNERKAVTQRYDQFARGQLEDPEMQELDQVFKDRVDSKIVGNNLFLKPSLIWDEEKYKETVKNSGAPKVEQALALQEFKPLREQASKSMVESLALTDEDFKGFAESGAQAGKSNTEILDEWRTAMKLPAGIFGTIQGIGRQLSYGLSGGLAGLERAGAGVGAILGVPGAQEAAAEAGKEAQSFAARRQVEGGPGFVGDVAEGLVSVAPTIAVGAAGAALAPVTAGTSLALTGLAAGALTGGLQSAGASQADSYEYRRNVTGESPEQALAGSRYDAAASGLITTAVTALSGKVGDKLGLGRGVEGLFRTPTGRAALRSGLRTGVVSTFTNATEEGIEEATDQLLQGVYERYSRDPNKDFQTILEETVQAGTIGATLGGGLAATRSALSELFNRAPQTATVEQLEQELAARDSAKATPEAQAELGKASELSVAAANAEAAGAPAVAQVAEQIAQRKVAEINRVAEEVSSGLADIGTVEGDIVAGLPVRTRVPVPTDLQAGLAEAPAPEGGLLGLVPQRETPTPAATLPAVEAATPTVGLETPQPQEPNAPEIRQVEQDGQQERVNVDEGGATAEAGGGNRPVEGGQVAQEEDVTPAIGQEPSPPEAAPAPKPKKTRRLGKNPLQSYDLLDFLQENNIGIPKAKFRKKAGEWDWLEKGDLKSVLPFIGTYTESARGNVDTLAQQAFEQGLIADPTADALIEGVRNGWKARQQNRAAGAEPTGIAPGAEQTRKQFERAAFGKEGEPVDPRTLNVGDRLTIGDVPMTVTDLTFPEDEAATDPESVTLEGGRFGRQTLGTDTPIRAAAIERAAPPVDEFALEAPTAEDLQTEAETQRQRDLLRERQAAPLTGTAGDIGTPDMFDTTAGDVPLFDQPQVSPATGAVPTESLPADTQPTSGDVGTVSAATRALNARIANMTPKAQESWTPELRARAEQFFQNPEQSLGDVPVIKARAIREAYLESLPEADRVAQQNRWDAEARRASQVGGRTAPAPAPEPTPTIEEVVAVPTPEAVAQPERMTDEKFATFEAMVKARRAAGTLSKEMAASYRQQRELRGLAPTKPRAKAKKPAAGPKKPAGPSKRRVAADQKVADALAEFQRIARAAARENQQTVGMGGIPVGTLRRSPELVAAAVKLTAALVDSGVVRFADFAEQVYSALPDLWNSIKGVALEAWQIESEFNDAMEQVDDDTANAIFAEVEAQPNPDTVEATIENPAEQAADPMNAPLGFGGKGRRNKSVRELLSGGETNYLFRTLFDDAQMRSALASNSAEVQRARELVRGLEEYQNFLREETTSDAEWAERNAPLKDETELALGGLRSAGFTASLDANGRVLLRDVPQAYRSMLREFGFQYDPKLQNHVNRDFQKVLGFAQAYHDDVSGQTIEKDNRSADGRMRSRFRETVASKANESALSAGDVDTYLATDIKEQMFSAAGTIPMQALVEQAHDAALIAKAQRTGKPMFMLASEAGTGKTYVMAASLAEMRRNGVAGRILYVTNNETLIEQTRKVFESYGVNDVEFSTYSKMDDPERFAPSPTDVLVLDEAHNVRFRTGDEASTRAEIGGQWMAQAKFTLLASATPFESIEQMHFLWPTGVFEGVTEKPYGNAERGWFNFVVATGGKVQRRNDGTPAYTKFPDNPTPEQLLQNGAAARGFLEKGGMFVQRNAIVPEGAIDSNFVEVPADPKWERLSTLVTELARDASGLDWQTRAYIVNLLKRVSEYAKIPAAIEQAKREIADGRRVTIFLESKSERQRDLRELVAEWDAAQEAGMDLPDSFSPKIAGVIEFFRSLIAAGITDINFEAAQDLFRKGLGAENVAFYTGDETTKEADDSLGRWRAGEVPVLVATMAKGGTGLSLHDTSEGGTAPRSQIVLTLPWRATETEQVAKRIARYGMTSKARIFWLFSPNLSSETLLASRVGGRMQSMSTLVNGVVSEAGSTIQSWQFDPILNDFMVTPDSPLTAPSEGMVQLTKELNAYLSSEGFTGRIVGPVNDAQLEAGLARLEKLIPGVRDMVRLESRAKLLKDTTLPESAKNLVRNGAQGFHYDGIAYVVRENVRQLAQHKTPADAATAVIFHELMHRGSKLLREAPQFRRAYNEWQAMVSANVSSTDLDNLVRLGYTSFAGWRTDAEKKAAAQEEAFVRKLEELLTRRGEATFGEQSLLRRFLNWMQRVLNSVFGDPVETKMSEELLRDWGKKYVQALNGVNTLSNFEAGVQPSVAPTELPETEGTRRTPLDSYTEPQRQALLDFAKQSGSNAKLAQILGMAEAGNVGTSEQLAPLSNAAKRVIGFTEQGDSGAPVVTAQATANAKSIALQLLDPKSNYGATYQMQFGAESAATAVLQMELTRYALAMLRKGDNSLIGLLRQNWNSVMLGTYLSATAAGRVLRARSYYVSDVLSTIEELEAAQKQFVADHLGKLGVEAPQTLLEEVEGILRSAQLDADARFDLREALEINRNADKINELENDRNLWLRGIELMPDNLRSMYEELTLRIQEVAFLEQQEREMDAKTPEASLLNVPVAERFARAASRAELDERKKVAVAERDRLAKALAKALAPKTRTAPEPEGPTADDDTSVEDATDDNEATEAAKRIIDELKAFLDKKYSTKKVPPTVYDQIKAIIDKAVANAPEYGFPQFDAEARAALGDQEIDEAVLEELMAKAWSVYLRMPTKIAQKTSAQFQTLQGGVERKAKLEPRNVEKLRELIRQSVLNKDSLGEAAFVARMQPQLVALTVDRADAESLAKATFNESVRRKTERRKRKIEGVRTAILAGSRNGLLREINKADATERLDPNWRNEALLRVLTKSGLTSSEASDVVSSFTEAEFDSIFTEGIRVSDAARAKALQDSAERLIKRYEEMVKRPKTEEEKAREFRLETLARQHVRLPLEKNTFVAEAISLGATEAQGERLFALAEEQRRLVVAESATQRAQSLLARYREIGTRTKSAKEADQDAKLVELVNQQETAPLAEADFLQQATALGLDAEQAQRVFRASQPRNPTLLSKLVTYILSAPEAIRNVPETRDLALREFLKQNGLDEARINSAMEWIKPQFDKYIQQAKRKALDDKFRVLESAKLREQSRFATMTDSSLKQLESDLKLIRSGLGDFEADPTQALAKKLGFEGFRPEDYRTLAELDFSITQARENGMAHDMARGLKELYELLARRKAPKTFLERMVIVYNNSALSGVGTLAINIIAPAGSVAIRAGMDIGRAAVTGRWDDLSTTMKILKDSFRAVTKEIEFGLVGGANINAMQQQVGRVTNLQPDFNAALKIAKDKKASPVARLKAAFVVAQSATDVTRRILGTTDHVWYSVMQNYFSKTLALKELTNAGIPREVSMPLLFARTQENGDLLALSLARIEEVRGELDAAFKRDPNSTIEKLREILATPIDERFSPAFKAFETDLRAALRRTATAYQVSPTKTQRYLMAELKLQTNAAYLRADDIARKQMLAGVQKLVDPTGDRNIAEKIERTTVTESEYELGTHRGEEAPFYDVANMASNLILKTGGAVLAKNPLFGRMLLGYFGIPVNLLNRALWFTPYGLIRYGIASKAMKTPEGRAKSYQQSMATAETMRQRRNEAYAGTLATTMLLTLKALSDDDDEVFNVTLAGPVNKTEYDAWYKMGNRRGSLQLNIGDRVFSLNWARGPLEPLKVALMLVGAVDDMRLNRKMGDTGLQVSLGDYLSAVLSGWSQQASFFGAKTTVGAVFGAPDPGSVMGTALYKLNPVVPFSGLIASVEKFIAGPNQFRGRESSIFMNLPIFRSLLTERAVNPIGDPLGLSLEDPFSQISERLWYAGMPFTLQKKLSGTDAAVYQLFLDKGVAPGLPQRSALEFKNGLMWDTDWLNYVEVRGAALKKDLARNLARFRRMDEDALRPAMAELSSRASREAKRKLNLK